MAPKKQKTNRRKKVKKSWRTNIKKVIENLDKDAAKDVSLVEICHATPLDSVDDEIIRNLEESLMLSDSEYEDIDSDAPVEEHDTSEPSKTYDEFKRKLSFYGSESEEDEDYIPTSDYTTDTEEKDSINLVIRGVPLHFTEKHLMLELLGRGYNPVAIHRMISQVNWHPMRLVLVQVPCYEKHRLLNERVLFEGDVRQINISVELHGRGYKIVQCTKCNQFGHTNQNCDLLVLLKKKTSKDSSDLGIDNRTISEDSKDAESRENTSGNSSEALQKKKKDEVNTVNNKIDELLANAKSSNMLSWSIKGVPADIKTAHVLDDLRSKHFSVEKILRLQEIIVIQLPETESHIWYMSCILGFLVTVENYYSNITSIDNTEDKKAEPSKKLPISVVIRGVPVGVPDEVVLEDLRRKKFKPLSIQRMIKPLQTTVIYLPMHKVQVPKEEGYIHNLTCLLGFQVKVEPFVKHLYMEMYCMGCQKYGHDKSTCLGAKRKKNVDSDMKVSANVRNYVIKGIPLEFESDKTIIEALKLSSFHPVAVHRMQKDDLVLPMYLVQLPQTEHRILKLSCLLGFSLIVETFKPSEYSIEQCAGCKSFGHSKSNCEKEKPEPKSSWAQACTPTKKIIHNNLPITKSVQLQTEPQSCEKCKNSSPSWSHLLRPQEAKDFCTDRDSTPINRKDLNKEIRNHRNVSNECLQSIRNLTHNYEDFLNSHENIKTVIRAALSVQPVCTSVGTYTDVTIVVLKSLLKFLINIPNVPGVTSHMINEQIHLLEELEDIKKASHERITDNYEYDFPPLGSSEYEDETPRSEWWWE